MHIIGESSCFALSNVFSIAELGLRGVGRVVVTPRMAGHGVSSGNVPEYILWTLVSRSISVHNIQTSSIEASADVPGIL